MVTAKGAVKAGAPAEVDSALDTPVETIEALVVDFKVEGSSGTVCGSVAVEVVPGVVDGAAVAGGSISALAPPNTNPGLATIGAGGAVSKEELIGNCGTKAGTDLEAGA